MAQRHPRHAPDLRGPRVRRRGPRHPHRQHRRRPAHRLDRRVQQLHRAVRAVRHRHGQPPGAAGAVRVPVRPLGRAGRRRDARLRLERRLRRPQRRAVRRDRPDHAEGPRSLAGPERRPGRPAGRQHPGRQARRAAQRELRRRQAQRRRDRQRSLGGVRRRAVGLGGVAREGCRGRVRRRRHPAGLLRGRRVGEGDEADRRLEGERLRHLRLLLADRLQVRRPRPVDQQDRHGAPHRERLDHRRAGRGRQHRRRQVLRPARVGVGHLRHGLARRRGRSSPINSRHATSTAIARGLNTGLVGVGSDNSRGVFDSFVVQTVPPQTTFDTTEDFSDGIAERLHAPPARGASPNGVLRGTGRFDRRR